MTEQRIIGGCFQVVSELSSGGFGQTFLAEDVRRSGGQNCVIKHLKPQSKEVEIINLAKRLFEQEVRILYQIGEHPQIPSIITHFEEGGEFYFVQEYIEGNTFAQELAQGKIYNHQQVVEIVTELLSVLTFVHNQGVIHRDIKPANLINRKSDGKTVLIDFGAVKQVENQTVNDPNQATKGTIAIGSEGYMPMEQLAGHPRFSSDVYAVGMFAIQLLTRTHPTQLRQNQRTGEWIWQDKVTVNNQLAEFLNRMIRYDFRQRFADAVEALNYLKMLGLNVGNAENYSRFPNSFANNNAVSGSTQATFYNPAEVKPEFAANNPPPQYHQTAFAPPFVPQFEQYIQPIHPNLQKYERQTPVRQVSAPLPNTQFITRAANPNLLASSRQNLPDSIFFSGIGLDELKSNFIFRALIFVGVLTILSILVYGAIMSVIDMRFGEKQYTQADQEIQKPMDYVNSPLAKKDQSKGFMSSAFRMESKAVTANDWFAVAEEWKKAQDRYVKKESSAATNEERENARKDIDFCSKKGLAAFTTAQTKKENK